MKTRHLAAPATLAALLALTACGSDTEAAPHQEPEPSFDQAAATAEFEDTISDAIGGQKITDFCDDAYTEWKCFFDHFDRPKESEVEVYLGLPGGVDKDAAGADAGQWVANILGDQLPNIDTVTVLDSHGTVLNTTSR